MSSPHQDRDAPREASDSQSFHFHLIGLIVSLVFAVVFFYLGRQNQLEWTPVLATSLGFCAILLIYLKKLASFEKQLSVWFCYSAIIVAIFYFEFRLRPNDEGKLRPASDPITAEDLLGSFNGFHNGKDGRPSFIALEIEEIVREPQRTSFRYSVNEGLRRTRGIGILYTSTSTLQLDQTIFLHYQRDDNGQVILWTFDDSSYWLSKSSKPYLPSAPDH